MADWYLSRSGSDANSGRTSSAPKLTWAAVKPLLGNGDRIIFMGAGRWPERINPSGLGGLQFTNDGSSNRPEIYGGTDLAALTWTDHGGGNWWVVPPMGYGINPDIGPTIMIVDGAPATLRKTANFSLSALTADFDWNYDAATRRVYMRHVGGTPANGHVIEAPFQTCFQPSACPSIDIGPLRITHGYKGIEFLAGCTSPNLRGGLEIYNTAQFAVAVANTGCNDGQIANLNVHDIGAPSSNKTIPGAQGCGGLQIGQTGTTGGTAVDGWEVTGATIDKCGEDLVVIRSSTGRVRPSLTARGIWKLTNGGENCVDNKDGWFRALFAYGLSSILMDQRGAYATDIPHPIHADSGTVVKTEMERHTIYGRDADATNSHGISVANGGSLTLGAGTIVVKDGYAITGSSDSGNTMEVGYQTITKSGIGNVPIMIDIQGGHMHITHSKLTALGGVDIGGLRPRTGARIDSDHNVIDLGGTTSLYRYCFEKQDTTATLTSDHDSLKKGEPTRYIISEGTYYSKTQVQHWDGSLNTARFTMTSPSTP